MPPTHKDREEILARKRKLEKERYQRLKQDRQRLSTFKEKKKQYYETKKNEGKIKSIASLTPREQRSQRKQWKKNSSKYRNKKKELVRQTQMHMANTTPPDSEEEANPAAVEVQARTRRTSVITDSDNMNNSSPVSDRRVLAGRERALRNRIKKNKLLKHKEEIICNLKSKLKLYQKKLSKLMAKKNAKSNSPMSKVQKIIKRNDPSEIKKSLLFGEVMKEQLSENVKRLKSHKEKQIFASAIAGNIAKKYSVLEKEKILTHKRLAMVNTADNLLITKRKLRKDKVSEETKASIVNFLEQDNHSRICSGKNETITKEKQKKQKRYLLYSLKQLFTKYNHENSPVSRTTFYNSRPFWILKPSVHDRDTCLCKIHANFDLLLEALYKRDIVNVANFNDFLEAVCCNKYSEECLARKCRKCKRLKVKYLNEFDNSQKVNYKQWENTVEEIFINKTKIWKPVKKVAKVEHQDLPYNIVNKLQDSIPKIMKHHMNIAHQYGAIKSLKEKLAENEILIHADFSENYNTKYSSEIQAFHFGGSRKQIAMHTVVVYYNSGNGETKSQCFCTLSEILDHDASAIWPHLKPVLYWISVTFKTVSILHFLSDGPVTQYRNKYMFFILANKVKFFFPNINMLSWNYSEAGHGKGAPDGVGATCKRTADMLVAQGKDITDITTLSKELQDYCKNIKICTITEDDFNSVQLTAVGRPPPSFAGTLKVHQVVCKKDTFKLNMKSLSCFCKDMFECNHYLIGCLDYVMDYERQREDDAIYSSSESEMTLGDLSRVKNKENLPEVTNLPGPSDLYQKIQYHNGDHVLVKFKTKTTTYRYAGLCMGEMDEDEGEIKITFLKVASANGTLFKIDQNAVYDVAFEDIIEKLPQPALYLKGERVFYKFKAPINVFEQ